MMGTDLNKSDVFMTLMNSTDESAEPNMALKIEPLFDPAYKPSSPSDGKTLVNVVAQRDCKTTVMSVHERVIAIGTTNGLVVICDPLGYVDHKLNVYHPHARSVSALDIDSTGEFVVSGGEDGRVVVLDLASSGNAPLIQLLHDRPIKAVALDPEFHRSRERRVIISCGGRVIIYVNKRAVLFSSNEPQQTVLVDSVVSILRLAWQPTSFAPVGATPLIAWASERGFVTLYDERRKSSAGLIRPEPAQIISATSNSDKVSATFSMSIAWLPHVDNPDQGSSILVVCSNLVRILRVTGGHDPRGSDVVTPRLTHVTHRIPLNSDIAIDGVIASLNSDDSMNFAACIINRPYELVLCGLGDYRGTTAPQISTHQFPTNDKIVGVASLPLDHLVYILSENGAVYTIRLRSLKGRDGQRQLTEYVNYLLTTGDADKAASLLPRIFDNSNGKDYQQLISWEQWLSKFDQLGQLATVATYLPTTRPDDSRSACFPSKERYNIVLERVLNHSPKQFEDLISRLSPELYAVDAVSNLVSEALIHDPRNRHLMASLAFLCCTKRQFDRAINLLLQLRHESLFKVVADNGLYHLLQKRIAEVVACGDTEMVVKMLIDNAYQFPPQSVIAQLKATLKSDPSSATALFCYLKHSLAERPDELEKVDYDLLVTLYADLDPDNLLNFLKSTHAYRLEHALAECRRRKLSRECVFLLGKGGKMMEAIDVILKQLDSVEEAVNFCREKGGATNRDLWMLLADRVVQTRPNKVAELLQLTGTELLDPAEVIKLIPTASGRLVPGLRQALEGSLADSERQLTLLSSARKVVGNDLTQVLKEISRSAFSATVVVSDRAFCEECHEPLSHPQTASMRLVAFTCRHTFHFACLTSAEDADCPVCGRLKERTSNHASRASVRRSDPQDSSTSLPNLGALLSGLPFGQATKS